MCSCVCLERAAEPHPFKDTPNAGSDHNTLLVFVSPDLRRREGIENKLPKMACRSEHYGLPPQSVGTAFLRAAWEGL